MKRCKILIFLGTWCLSSNSFGFDAKVALGAERLMANDESKWLEIMKDIAEEWETFIYSSTKFWNVCSWPLNGSPSWFLGDIEKKPETKVTYDVLSVPMVNITYGIIRFEGRMRDNRNHKVNKDGCFTIEEAKEHLNHKDFVNRDGVWLKYNISYNLDGTYIKARGENTAGALLVENLEANSWSIWNPVLQRDFNP